jgi:Fe-S cluster assembly protein SufD
MCPAVSPAGGNARLSWLGAHGALADQVAPWATSLRQRGRKAFLEQGWPTRRAEAWKYTDIARLGLAELPMSAGNGIEATVSAEAVPSLFASARAAHRLVFVDGHLKAGLGDLSDLPAGVTMAGLREPEAAALPAMSRLGSIAQLADAPLLALNTALMTDGLIIDIAAGVEVARPIEVIFLGGGATDPAAWHPRLLVTVGAGSALTLIEHHASLRPDAAFWANHATELMLAPHARLLHHVLLEGEQSVHTAATHASVAESALYKAFGLTIGGKLSRREWDIRLDGKSACAELTGAYLVAGQQHCDNTLVIRHRAPQTACRQIFKGAVNDRAHAVFQGQIVVEPQAQKADGHQLSRALVLSDEAEVDQKPSLEIFADDVKCSHGASIGHLDRDALFYCLSRGIAEATARRLLVEGFVAETLDGIAMEELREALRVRIGAALEVPVRRER